MSIKIEMIGKRFGRLMVISQADNCTHHLRWNCLCDCGKKTISYGNQLRNGLAKSCGCLSREKMKETNTKHGYRHTKIYSSWCNIKKRCYNSAYSYFKHYGGRGIKVCEEWASSFIAFKEWSLVNGYQEGLEIDRVNVNGNYEPDNCKWSNRTQQVRNRTNTVFIEHKGERKTLKEWSEISFINYKLAHARYKRGLAFNDIFK